MGKWIKRIVTGLMLAFIIYFVVSYPAQSAAALNTFFTAIVEAFWRVYSFFASIGA